MHGFYRSIGEVLTEWCGCIGSTGVLGKYCLGVCVGA